MFHLTSFLVYIFVTAYTPGPNNIMSLGNATRFGFRKSFFFNLGIFAGFAIVMPLCTLFSAVLMDYLPLFKPFMIFIGAAYMLYLAWKTWKSSSEIDPKASDSASFRAGMLLQFINPKIYIYAITSMSAYILPAYSAPLTLIGFASLLAFVGFTGTVAWSLFGSLFCNLMKKRARLVNTVMALLLVYCAVSLFL